ncbi:MAG: NfeD family protein [Bacilli bacterium]|nr:NfeD family protein [Bacilli bacterium]
MEQWYVWLIIVIILTILEATTINLTTIWFVASGIIALISSLFIDNYIIQFGIFVVVGVLLLITTKPILEKMLKQKKEATNLDRIIGSTGLVTEKISKSQNGEVKVDGKRWTASADKTIKVGSTVKVLSINGVKLKVEELEDDE